MTRDDLIKEYLAGVGLEIGALHNPIKLEGTSVTKIYYVDRMTVEELRRQYPELEKMPLVEPDIIDDAQELKKVESGKYDFIIANHVIEHMDNPVLAISSWMKKLREGGFLFMAVPDKRLTFDKKRKLTSLSHLVKDYEDGKYRVAGNAKHYLDWAKNFSNTDVDIKQRAKELQDMNYSIHFHCWNFSSFKRFLKELKNKNKLAFEFVDEMKTQYGGNEFIFILKKTGAINEKGVDIILPTYNACDYVKTCVRKIFKYTDLTNNRLIIINDKSTERELNDYLNKLKYKKIHNVEIIENTKNLGFVGTTNKGMLYSKRDVVLLNTDTEVTGNWLNKLKRCADSSNDIATVTPLSNNATICSVPRFGYDNKLPEGFSVDTFADLIEEKSLGYYTELPTGVGFCIYIKRKVIDKFGVFDEKLFGKGYGEENEFCARVARHGFKNVVCDDTFIYHKGSASFTDKTRINKGKKNIKIIDSLYDGYSQSITDFVKQNSVGPVYKNIHFWIKHKRLFLSNNKKVMLVMHYEPSIGGVGINTNQICVHNQDEYDFFLFTTDIGGRILIKVYNKGSWTVLFRFANEISNHYSIKNKEVEEIFENTLKYLRIDIVHFQHLMGLPLALMTIPRQVGIKSIVSLHDYYFLSISPQLIGRKDLAKFDFSSDGRKDGLRLLESHYCIDGKHGFDNDIYRIRFVKDFFKSVDKIISPSVYVKEIYQTILRLTNNTIEVREHGVSFKKSIKIVSKKKKLAIAFLGIVSHHKGFEDFVSLMVESEGKDIRWLIIGDVSQEWLDYMNRRGVFEGDYDLKMIGYYDVNSIENIILSNKVDLIIFPSICSETYSYTLSEAVQCNVPVLARDIGALGERTKANDYGWVYGNYTELVEKVKWLLANRQVLEDKKMELKSKNIELAETVSKWYGKTYESLLTGTHKYPIDFELNRLFENAIVESEEPIFNNINDIAGGRRDGIKKFIKGMPILGKIALRIKRSIID